MINSVLLQGFLAKEQLKQSLAEIREISLKQKTISIVISSNAGDAVYAVEFVEAARGLAHAHYEVKIYEASSTAAYIALALGEEKEMSRNATLKIHRGEMRLSPSQISPEGKIDEDLVNNFKRFDRSLVDVLKKTKLNEDQDLMSRLYATDWLCLSARECFRRGIVQRLF